MIYQRLETSQWKLWIRRIKDLWILSAKLTLAQYSEAKMISAEIDRYIEICHDMPTEINLDQRIEIFNLMNRLFQVLESFDDVINLSIEPNTMNERREYLRFSWVDRLHKDTFITLRLSFELEDPIYQSACIVDHKFDLDIDYYRFSPHAFIQDVRADHTGQVRPFIDCYAEILKRFGAPDEWLDQFPSSVKALEVFVNALIERERIEIHINGGIPVVYKSSEIDLENYT